MAYEFKITPELLTTAIERIVAAVHPLEIIAFGSRARGDARPDSDLDLLVIVPETDMSNQQRFDTAVDLLEILGDMPFAKDVIVSNPEHLLARSAELNSVYRDAARDGIFLWQRNLANTVAISQLSN